LFKFKDSKLFLNRSLTSAKILFNLLANSVGLGLVIMNYDKTYSTHLI